MKFGKLTYSFSSHNHATVKGPDEQMKSARDSDQQIWDTGILLEM